MFSILDTSPGILGPGPVEGASQSQTPSVKPSRRRDKPQLSCTICRQKKLKCDRLKPCLNCTKRGQAELCDFIKQDTSHSRSTRQQSTTNVHLQNRVRQLEDMITTLLNIQTASNFNQDVLTTAISPSSTTTGIMDGGFTQSAAPSPGEQMNANFPEALAGRPQILFGDNYASRAEIISSIPPKPVCDVLISRWFSSRTYAYVHERGAHITSIKAEKRLANDFHEWQYDQMFKEPNETPLMWIGLLFSILGLASYFYAVSGEELHSMPQPFTSMWEMSIHFRDRTAQCLVEVNYLRPRRYTVDTLCFYYALDAFHNRDSDFGAYVVLGIIVRVAMRLGYHRDASHYPAISPFDGEMRRRIWSMVFQLDILTSAYIGLPRMIREGETDTAEPKNLLDTDFDESMAVLPHPRPSTEATPVAYSIFKVRLLRQFGLIVDQINSITPISYDSVMRLDARLLETHATLPSYLKMKALSQSITDDALVILRRYTLEVNFQKSRCVLHRKYLICGKSHARFRYSRTASVDAAMRLLDVQRTFDEASQPGGQLSGEKWRRAALINQDYVLAAMVLCLDLAWGRRMNGHSSLSSECEDDTTMWPRGKMLEAVRASFEIWCKSRRVSALAVKATEALGVMLKDLDSTDAAESQPSTSVPNAPNLYAYHATPSSTSTSTSPPAPLDPSTQYTAYAGLDSFAFAGPTDADMNFDWELWDSQFQTTPMAGDDFGSATFQ
ncbi:Fusarisetin A cluster transcription factor [Lachnellula occidentalis]|uniref:Fusarisetin A cluster transcription factor n=1 Tax=Lachnellula occidentalis TaxID=215460 RepID=A0A8H8U9L0_9HELO|nr:Fusarisetin A cluster transcription factor [Lachnellula occidentalis]